MRVTVLSSNQSHSGLATNTAVGDCVHVMTALLSIWRIASSIQATSASFGLWYAILMIMYCVHLSMISACHQDCDYYTPPGDMQKVCTGNWNKCGFWLEAVFILLSTTLDRCNWADLSLHQTFLNCQIGTKLQNSPILSLRWFETSNLCKTQFLRNNHDSGLYPLVHCLWQHTSLHTNPNGSFKTQVMTTIAPSHRQFLTCSCCPCLQASPWPRLVWTWCYLVVQTPDPVDKEDAVIMGCKQACTQSVNQCMLLSFQGRIHKMQ